MHLAPAETARDLPPFGRLPRTDQVLIEAVDDVVLVAAQVAALAQHVHITASPLLHPIVLGTQRELVRCAGESPSVMPPQPRAAELAVEVDYSP